MTHSISVAAPDYCPAPPSSAAGGLKWAAILCFLAAPFICTWTIVLHVEKTELFARRAAVDTVVVGDSRVRGIAEEPFAAKGWNYFNMGLGGVSPEDMAMELKYAMLHGKIRRVVIGVSFEGMTARYPFEFSRYYGTGPFASAEVAGFATVGEAPRPRPGGVRDFLRNQVLPVARANLRLRCWIGRALGREKSTFLANGMMDYSEIGRQITAGDYDFARQRDPNIFFMREDSESRYLEKPELAPCGERLYQKVFAALREAKITCVVFETGRTTEYQQMIDAHAELVQLQRRWREFFRAQSRDGVKFLDVAATRDCYVADDFFDAVHFSGSTGTRLAARLADELAAVEKANAKGASATHGAKTTP